MAIDLDFLVRKIKSKTGMDRGAIAQRINYSRGRFSTLVKENDEKTYSLLLNEFKKELEDGLPPSSKNEDILILSASVKMLYEEVATLKAINEKISQVAAVEKMRKRTNSILAELF